MYEVARHRRLDKGMDIVCVLDEVERTRFEWCVSHFWKEVVWVEPWHLSKY